MELCEILNLSPDKAAEALIGMELISNIEGKITSGLIVETEAYMPSNDAAAHNARGKTKANQSLFSDAGTLYVHSMRQHNLLDIVVCKSDSPGSVLIRALEPKEGIEIMKERRNTGDELNLCSGPGKLSKALAITREHDGINIFDTGTLIRVNTNTQRSNQEVVTGERIGISKDKEKPLRFLVKDSKYTS